MNGIIATANPGKAAEFRQMLAGGDIEWSALPKNGSVAPPEETGHTFRANACLKASYYATAFHAWALADDSGLAVDALAGKPGVHSARWAAMHQHGSDDADNNRLLLEQLKSTPENKRSARFVCVLALADPLGRIVLTTQDAVEGVILGQAIGENGFGYDPLFFIPALGKTTAQLQPDEKHAISHRGKALRRLGELIGRLPIDL